MIVDIVEDIINLYEKNMRNNSRYICIRKLNKDNIRVIKNRK